MFRLPVVECDPTADSTSTVVASVLWSDLMDDTWKQQAGFTRRHTDTHVQCPLIPSDNIISFLRVGVGQC